jgi:phage repressor protein C with HTH and peptisase S24 domain
MSDLARPDVTHRDMAWDVTACNDAGMTQHFVKEWRKAKGLTQAQLGDAVGLTETSINRIENGKQRLTESNVAAIARILGCGPGDLYSAPPAETTPIPPQSASSVRPADVVLPARAAMERNVPVYGTAAGSLVGAFQITSETIDYVRRPPTLVGSKNAYAIYVVGDSMSPQHKNGELRFVHPDRPVRIGDTVIIQVRNGEHEPAQAFIKNLIRRTADRVVAEQLNPPAEIEFKQQFVVAVHKVLGMNELFEV